VSSITSVPDVIRVAIDADSVIFSNEADQVFQQQGFDAFINHEVECAKNPLPPGPFQPFINALCTVRRVCPETIRIGIFTSRSAPTHERIIRTLHAWGISVDEIFFLGGMPKMLFLAGWHPDIFFDDNSLNIESAIASHVPAAQVVKN
jgi:5'-nucleotidase